MRSHIFEQTGRQAGRQTERQTDRQRNRQMHVKTKHRFFGRWKNEQKVKRVNEKDGNGQPMPLVLPI